MARLVVAELKTSMRRISVALAWASVAIVVAAFFLPWARIDLREPGGEALTGLTDRLGRVTVRLRRGAQTVTGDLSRLSDIPRQVSGAQIPQLANQEQAQVAAALLELLTNQRQQIGLKSYAVYLVPGLALLCAFGVTFLGGRRAVAVGLALICAGIAGAGCWKLLTTNTETLFVAITIGEGLWLSLLGYVGLAAAAGWLAVHTGGRA